MYYYCHTHWVAVVWHWSDEICKSMHCQLLHALAYLQLKCSEAVKSLNSFAHMHTPLYFVGHPSHWDQTLFFITGVSSWPDCRLWWPIDIFIDDEMGFSTFLSSQPVLSVLDFKLSTTSPTSPVQCLMKLGYKWCHTVKYAAERNPFFSWKSLALGFHMHTVHAVCNRWLCVLWVNLDSL